MTATATIMAHSGAGGDCSGSVTDAGYNLADDKTCGFTASTSHSDTPAGLDPSGLQSNGGLTQTVALVPGSAAIGAVKSGSLCSTSDQRGIARTTPCDIGAYQTEFPSITSASAATCSVGSACSFTVTTAGSLTASLTESGNLPLGVTFKDNGNGTASLAGTPSSGAGGEYSLTVTANNGVPPNATQSFTLIVDQAPSFTSSNNVTFTKGVNGSFPVTVAGYPVPTVTESGTLPSGVTFTGGKLHGTSTVTGTFHITFTAKNGVAPNATQNFTLKVLGLHVVTTTLPGGKTGKAYSATLSAIGGTPPYSWTLVKSEGTLPKGLVLKGSGLLSGTPTGKGTFQLTVRVAEAKKYGGESATAVITLAIR